MRQLPLYSGYNSSVQSTKGQAPEGINGNAGLWFSKFCTLWEEQTSGADAGTWQLVGTDPSKDPPSAKHQSLKTTVEQYNSYKKQSLSNGSPDCVLARANTRQQALANAHDSVCISVESIGPFVTGMGSHHPVENGFRWHHTLGVPYLPGNGLKGVIRNWVESWDGELIPSGESPDNKSPDEQQAQNNRCFGLSDNKNSQVGGLIFLDALPHAAPSIGVDVMTPHYKDWYSQGGELDSKNPNSDAVPAGWHSPVPIPFLVVKKIKLDIVVLRQASMPDKLWKQAKKELPKVIQDALNIIGAGAKTAVGYGCFKLDDSRARNLEEQSLAETAQREEAVRVGQLSALEQRYEQDIQNNNQHKNPEIVAAIKLLEEPVWAECQVEMAELIKAKMQQNKQGNYCWKTSTKKKKPETDKAYQNTLKVMNYLSGKS